MPNLFNSLFRKNSPRFIPGEKIVRPKTVSEVLGEAFNYEKTITSQSTFCKKLLKYTIKEFSHENLIFLLMHEKYSKQPTPELFKTIYRDFISSNGLMALNISSPSLNSINIKWNNGNPLASSTDFDGAEHDARMNLKDTLQRLPHKIFDTAFFLTPIQKNTFDEAISYLQKHQINLI